MSSGANCTIFVVCAFNQRISGDRFSLKPKKKTIKKRAENVQRCHKC